MVSGSSAAGFTMSPMSLGLCPNAISKGVGLLKESLVLFRIAYILGRCASQFEFPS